MTTKQNLHTHCTFCDGKDAMETMVRAAIDHGLTSLGFSSHNYTGFPWDECGIHKDQIDAYFQEIDRLQETYPQITLYRGFEIESRSQDGTIIFDPRLQYSIGSCHIFATPKGMMEVDYSPERYRQAIDAFGGNVRTLVENYFQEVVRYAKAEPFSIIGHFDLVTKFLEKEPFFDEQEGWYQDMAIGYLEEAARTGKIFEVNTGAISRGWRQNPYPATFLLERLHSLHAPVLISSDCHSAGAITCHFDETENLLKSIGFKEQMQLTDHGFQPVSL